MKIDEILSDEEMVKICGFMPFDRKDLRDIATAQVKDTLNKVRERLQGLAWILDEI